MNRTLLFPFTIFLCLLTFFLLYTTSAEAFFLNEADDLMAETASESSDLSLFFGRFHPVLVHLPIGFLLMAFLLEFVSLIKQYEKLSHAVPFVLLMGFLSGLFSAVTGWLLSDGGGYNEELLSFHKWLGISVVVLSLAAWLLRVTLYDVPLFKKIFRVTLTVMVVLLIGAGHYGGSLTHGSDYLFRYMPEPVRSWIGIEAQEPDPLALIEDLQTAHVYRDVIEPIFAARCQSCHDPDRTEGELMMISYEHLMRGGQSGSPIEPYQAEQSDLYRRLRLPDRHDERMPPRGRTQLTADQIRLIGWWIEQGAPSDPLVAELERPGEIQSILERMTVGGQPFFERVQVAVANPQHIEDARSRGFRISPVAEDLGFLQVSTLQSKNTITREDMEILRTLSEQITWLNLSRTTTKDEDLENLPHFKNLTRLYLQHTDISDSTLARIQSLENLEYLNLYATGVTDDGLRYLETLQNLNTIYLWQTGVTDNRALALKDRIPGIYINIGVE